MSWNPRNNTVDVSRLVKNVFDYIEAHQEEALKYYAPTNTPPNFKKFFTSASGRVEGVYPSLMLISQEKAVDYSRDVLRIGVELTFEGHIQGGKPDVITKQAHIYATAVESMLANIDMELIEGVLQTVDALNTKVESVLAVMRGNKPTKPTAFLQGFQTQVTYLLIGESY